MEILWKDFKGIIILKPNNSDTLSHLDDDNGVNISDSIHIKN